MEQADGEDGTGGPDGVATGKRAAVQVDVGGIKLGPLDAGDGLGGVSLHDLGSFKILGGEAGLCQGGGNGRDGGKAGIFGTGPKGGGGQDAQGARGVAGDVGGCDNHKGGGIGGDGGGGGGNGACEDRGTGGDPGGKIAGKEIAGTLGEAYDFMGKAVAGGDGAGVAGDGPVILRLAGDAKAMGDCGGSLGHTGVAVGPGGKGGLVIGGGVATRRIGAQAEGTAGMAFGPPGDNDARLPG